MSTMMAVKVVASLCCVGACSLLLYLCRILWLVPERLRRELRRQGIRGPPPSSFLYGNLADMRQAAVDAKQMSSSSSDGGIVHDYRPAVFPFYEKWRNEYGACIYISMVPSLSIDVVHACMHGLPLIRWF